MKIGIIGAGMVGRAVAVRAVASGHDVMISNSRGPKSLFTLRASLGCAVGTTDEAIRHGEIVVVAIPLEAYPSLPAEKLASKIVIDTGNYYPDRDGRIAELDRKQTTTSEMLARRMPKSTVVKAFNAILATDLEEGAGQAGTNRRALPIVGDDQNAKRTVTELQNAFGFDTLDVGPLSEGWRFEKGTPAYCVPLDRDALSRTLSRTLR